jgi:hypothetical protein
MSDADVSDDEGQAVPSAATKESIRAAVAALLDGNDVAGEKIDEVVETWRADNAAGGLGVHQHLPLPNEFARQRLVGGSLGDSLVHVLRQLGPLSRAEALARIGARNDGR